MTAADFARRPRPKGGGAAPFTALLWRFSWLRRVFLLTPPMAWFVLVYFASLVLLLITAFWTIDPFTTQIVQAWNTDNFRVIATDPTYIRIVTRTLGIAAAVTVTDIVLAFPLAYYLAHVASRRAQTLLFAAVRRP